MSKESVIAAMEAHSAKQLNKARTQKRRNKSPEKDVEKDCCKWMKSNGWSHDIVEAAGGRNVYGAMTVKSGFADCVACDKEGRACYVEFKAKGRRSTLRESQRAFLHRKIRNNAFAVVVDSVDLLAEYYGVWAGLVNDGHSERAKAYLMDILPKSKIKDWDTGSGLGF